MPNYAPTQVVDIMEETARSSHRRDGRCPHVGAWRGFRWPLQSWRTESRRISRSGKQWSGYPQELRTEPRGRANNCDPSNDVLARRFRLRLFVVDLRREYIGMRLWGRLTLPSNLCKWMKPYWNVGNDIRGCAAVHTCVG
jgi:hypothetical protein